MPARGMTYRGSALHAKACVEGNRLRKGAALGMDSVLTQTNLALAHTLRHRFAPLEARALTFCTLITALGVVNFYMKLKAFLYRKGQL